MKRLCGALPGARLVLLTVLSAQAVHADPLSTVQMLREGGCGGVSPSAPPLRPDTTLNQVAQLWAEGRALADAADRVGYQAQRMGGLHVSGPDWSLVQQQRPSGCRAVMDRDMRAVGVYRRGTDTWLVLAYSPAAAGIPAASFPSSAGAKLVPAPLRPAPAPALQAGNGSVLASRALRLVNDVRAHGTRCGTRSFGPAPPLALSGTLSGVAFGHAADMAQHNYFEHQDPAGNSPADRVRAVGYREKLVGENIAYGPESVEEVVKGWLDSPGHCANIMDPRFEEMGIAVSNGRAALQGLYWVQVLAEPRA